jgi:hypothetical protein
MGEPLENASESGRAPRENGNMNCASFGVDHRRARAPNVAQVERVVGPVDGNP